MINLQKLNLSKISIKYIFLLGVIISSSRCTENNAVKESVEEAVIEEDKIDSDSLQNSSTLKKLEDYKIILSSNKEIITNHENLTISIWIGGEQFTPTNEDIAIENSNTIPARLGLYAKIKPYAPDFDIISNGSSFNDCLKIDETGSIVRYELQPKAFENWKNKTSKITATIELYELDNCEGVHTPKSSRTLTIIIRKSFTNQLVSGFNEIISIFWEKFLSFWGVLLTLLFGTLVFLIKKKIKAKKST